MSERISVAALQVTFDDHEQPDSRWARTSDLVRAHRAYDLVVLPELWPHGAFSPAGWQSMAEPLDGPHVERLSALSKETGVTLHGGSFVERGKEVGPQGRDLWNTSVVFRPDGELCAVYRKIHRFGFGEGEPLLMEAGDTLSTFRMGEATIALATCYDLRFPELFRNLVYLGAEVFLVPASWPAPRVEHWKLLGQARALENQAYVVQSNVTGAHGGLAMGGHSQIVDPTGRPVVQAGEEEGGITAELDLEAVRSFREDFPVLPDRRMGVPTPERSHTGDAPA